MKNSYNNPSAAGRSVASGAKNAAIGTANTAANIILNPGGMAYDAAVSVRSNVKRFINASDAEQDQMIGAGVMFVGMAFATRGVGEIGALGNGVIKETLVSSGNIKSAYKLTSSEALVTGERFLGPGYIQLGKKDSGVFRSTDGLRQFRIDNGSIDSLQPHVSFEGFQVGQPDPYVNNHVYLSD